MHFVLLGDMDEEGWHCKQGKQDKMNILQYSGTLF